MARNWPIDGRTIARKVKNPTWSTSSQSSSGESVLKLECPNCHYLIMTNDDWPGFPAGVKFDPSDAELLEHLAAKCGVGDSKPHVLIDEFIPTLTEEQGICSTHPKDLPGIKKDGSTRHYFHRTMNAYSTGQRKRRKIQAIENVRWHKTGKTRPMIVNGVHKGWKKIMVLYKGGSDKSCKPRKSDWVMHQYHLGAEEDEKGGEIVVSKISYQKEKRIEVNVETSTAEDPSTSPKTPKTKAPPLVGSKASPLEHLDDPIIPQGNNDDCNDWLVNEFHPYDENIPGLEDPLLCREILETQTHPSGQAPNQIVSINSIKKDDGPSGASTTPWGLSDLANLEFDTPPELINVLPLGSQESVHDWMKGLV